MEKWKPIEGYEGFYEVSNRGRVRRVAGSQYRFLKPRLDTGGYVFVTLCKSGKKKESRVHRLVGKAFLANPKNLPAINHRDFDRTNNHVDNLEWCTHQYNVRYSAELMRHPKAHRRPGRTGERYISMDRGRYRVRMKGPISKTFQTIDEAKAFRNQVMQSDPYYADVTG